MSDENVPAYAAYCKCGCNALIFACVDDPKQPQDVRDDTAESVAQMIREGYAIVRMTVGEVRFADFGCRTKQLKLIG